jgi:hypothetical protein
MRESTNPLDKIKIASPCSANWDEMYGSARKRFCAECKLNVYNISEMTKDEAENFILRSEGRLCLRIYQRRDGTVLTKDCPVGWARVKRRISRVYSAALGLAGGFLAGVLGLGAMRELAAFTDYKEVPEPFFKSKNDVDFGVYGSVVNLPEVKTNISKERKKNNREEGFVVGRPEKITSIESSIYMDPFRTPR